MHYMFTCLNLKLKVCKNSNRGYFIFVMYLISFLLFDAVKIYNVKAGISFSTEAFLPQNWLLHLQSLIPRISYHLPQKGYHSKFPCFRLRTRTVKKKKLLWSEWDSPVSYNKRIKELSERWEIMLNTTFPSLVEDEGYRASKFEATYSTIIFMF